MKVLLANKFFFRNGGSEAVMFQERNFLLKSGFDVIDFAMQDGRNLPSAYAEHFVANQAYTAAGASAGERIGSAMKLIHSPEAVRKIVQLIDHTRPDILHCHNIYHQLTPSIIGAASRRGLPVVLTLHDYKPVCPVYTRLRNGRVCSDCLDGHFFNVVKHRCADGSLGKSMLLYAEASLQRLMRNYEKVDQFIAPSEVMRESMIQQRVPGNRVEVVYNGIDCHTVHASEEDEGYVLFLGRLSAEKGVDTLLQAHADIADRVPLIVAGTGPMEADLRARYPLARFLGHVTGGELEDTLRRASLVVVPSEWYENCPMSVLEAMAHGKPVIASDIGGIPELVAHEQSGLLFEPGDRKTLQHQMMRLMQKADERAQFGAAARTRVEQHFSLERHNTALLGLYHAVIERARARSSHRRAPSQYAPPQE